MDVIGFSPNSDYLAVSGADGHLRIWETATNTLWHEFIPSSHLAATCTCLVWAPTHQESGKGKKKKRKKAFSGNVVVMGTGNGSLIFYDVATAQPLAQSSKTATTPGNINALTWSPWSLTVFTCGTDGIIREWDPENTTLLSHWNASKENLTAVQALKGQLLVGGQTITLWDLETKKSIAAFTGHPSSVSMLQIVEGTDYFVSMATADRHLKIWNTKQTYGVASLAVPELPSAMHTQVSDSGEVYVSVTSKKGQLHIYKQKLNGQVKKPLMPTSTIRIADTSNDSSEARILAGCVSGSSSPTVMVSYGDSLRLQFEKFDMNTLSRENTFPRQLSHVRSQKSKQKGASSESRVEVPVDAKHLQPGMEAVMQVPKGKKSEKKDKVDEGDLPMEERLTNLTVDAPTRSDLPQGENLGHLLSQGLHSKDQRILQSVLHRNDEKLILSTVRSLPVQLIMPLIEQIKVMLTGKSMSNHSPLKWLKAVFQIHSSYLMCSAVSDELMGPIVALLRSRETLYPQLCLLKGKLELVKGHVSAKKYKTETPNEALLTYQDDSSEDEDKQDDGFLPSESEEFLTSDDLDLDAENSGSDDDGKAEKLEDAESGSSDDSDDDEVDEVKVNGTSNHDEDDDDEESMDED